MYFIRFQFCDAKKVQGYIVGNESDTIFGEILIPTYDLLTRGYSINGINLESFYLTVRFKPFKKGIRKAYTPLEISAFGFESEQIHYKFQSFSIYNKSIIKSDRERTRFLNMIYSSKLLEMTIYRDVLRQSQYNHSTNSTMRYQTKVNYDYYLYHEEYGLKRIEKNEEYNTLIEMLRLYKVDNKFLEQLSPSISFMDVKKVLWEYEKWKRNKIKYT